MTYIVPKTFVANTVIKSADVNSNFTNEATEINRRATVDTYTPLASATVTLNLAESLHHRIQMPAGAITLAISNATVGDRFILSITQDAVGSRLVNWFSTIRWAYGVTPTLTTTASKEDTFGFVVTGSNLFDGYVVGQNI